MEQTRLSHAQRLIGPQRRALHPDGVSSLPAGRVLHRPTPRRRLLGGEALRGWRMKGLGDRPQETVTDRAVERCRMRNPRYPPACELGYDLPTDFGRGLRPVESSLAATMLRKSVLDGEASLKDKGG